jgi:hypothetical protein
VLCLPSVYFYSMFVCAVTEKEISDRLIKIGVSHDDAKVYATNLLKDKYNTPRKLSGLTKDELKDAGFAKGDQTVSIQAFMEWAGIQPNLTGCSCSS